MASSHDVPSASRTALPGFGRPLNYFPDNEQPDYVTEPFLNALSMINIQQGVIAQPLITLRELTMLKFMNSVTDKADWHIKINDEKITQKWRDEAMAPRRDMTSKMMDWCIDELRYKAALVPPAPATPPPIVVYNGDVVKSDFAVPEELKIELQEAVAAFEERIPPRLKDWHPESDEKVWDLVHPSLFPLVYGCTRILANGETTTLDDCIKRCGDGETIAIPPVEDTTEPRRPGGRTRGSRYYDDATIVNNPFSAKFQWLPCEVDIGGDEARITTYINNLHPEEKSLYQIISKLITASIPLWDITLAPLRDSNDRKMRIDYTEVEYDPDPEYGPETEGPQQKDAEDEWDFLERRYEWFDATKEVVLPDARVFEPLPEPPKFSLKETYAKQGLQVIVKLANIELTPKKPTYDGGSWHVEGQLNEHIVASSIYYYSCKNVTPSTLSFRQQCDDGLEIYYRQNQFEWLGEVFGCHQGDSCVQELGSVATREGRLLTFPNILQHRVGPFKLEDPTKPGHRKIVALFLVDPNIKVISTAHIPCQRRDWWWEETRSIPVNPGPVRDPLLSEMNSIVRLPPELQEEILQQMEDADFPMSLEEAKRLRLDLMEERKNYVIQNGSAFEESTTFNLCEH